MDNDFKNLIIWDFIFMFLYMITINSIMLSKINIIIENQNQYEKYNVCYKMPITDIKTSIGETNE